MWQARSSDSAIGGGGAAGAGMLALGGSVSMRWEGSLRRVVGVLLGDVRLNCLVGRPTVEFKADAAKGINVRLLLVSGERREKDCALRLDLLEGDGCGEWTDPSWLLLIENPSARSCVLLLFPRLACAVASTMTVQ